MCKRLLQERANLIYEKVSASILAGEKFKEVAEEFGIGMSMVTKVYRDEVKRRVSAGELAPNEVIGKDYRNKNMVKDNLEGMDTWELSLKYGMNRGYVACILRQEKEKHRLKIIEEKMARGELSGWAKRFNEEELGA